MKQKVNSHALSSTIAWRSLRCALVFGMLLFQCATVVAQPVPLKSLSQNANHFATAGERLFFSSSDSLFTSDGTPSGTVFVAELGENVNQMGPLSLGTTIFFTTTNESGETLWQSTGTPGSTFSLGTYVEVTPLLKWDSNLFFAIDDGVHGKELWKFSGSSLTMVADIAPGSADGYSGNIVISDNLLYFGANDGTGRDLWKSDGTAEGTAHAADMPADDFFGLTDVDGTIFFARTYYQDYTTAELWKTQGTTESTELIYVFDPDFYNNLYHFTSLNGRLYFIRDWSIPQQDLMASDGTSVWVVETVNIDGSIIQMKTMEGQLVFYGQSQSFPGPIMKSDGSAEGTTSVYNIKNMYAGYGDDAIEFTVADDMLFFVDDLATYSSDFENPQQLYQSDLTRENTKPLMDIYGTSFRMSDNVVAAGGSIFFTTNQYNDLKLWLYNPDAQPLCAGAGTIVQEIWEDVYGTTVESIPANTEPTMSITQTSFEGDANIGDHYGARYRALLCVPETGNYQFYIASNDNSELWLSSSSDPEAKTRIAYVSGYTLPGQYTKYASQRSQVINLQKGGLYYIEALHKEGVGTDHLSVAMKLPDGTMEAPIQGSRLIPFTPNALPTVTLTAPEDNSEYTAPASITFQATASDSDGEVERVEFYQKQDFTNEVRLGMDTEAPYELTWNNVPAGSYILHARAYDNRGGMSRSQEIAVYVNSCSATGTILREEWNGVQGNSVSDIPLNAAPHSSSYLTILEGPTNDGIHYGARIRGYICPPQTGNYTFYIASNDNSELWISADGMPANKSLIASVNGATQPRQWNRYANQRSVPIYLMANKRIYVEVLHKQGVGTDHVAVGWALPDGTQELPIPGSRLSPAQGAAARLAHFADPTHVNEEETSEITLSPNPSAGGPLKIAFGNFNDGHDVDVQVISLLGQVLHSQRIECGKGCDEGVIQMKQTIPPGVYIVNGKAGEKVFSKRLIVQ